MFTRQAYRTRREDFETSTPQNMEAKQMDICSTRIDKSGEAQEPHYKSAQESFVKPKKTPRIRVVMQSSGRPLSSNWADHEMHDFESRHIPSSHRSARNHEKSCEVDSSESCDSPSEVSEEGHDSDTMSLDGEKEGINCIGFSKAPDQVHNIINEWGKGTTGAIQWSFRRISEKYSSVGEVVKRTVRKGIVKLKIAYKPCVGHEGPSGFLFLPQSDKIRIWSIRTISVNKVPALGTVTLEEGTDEEPEDLGNDLKRDLEPLPTMAQIDPSFAVHVVAIFRAIVKEYPKSSMESEKTRIWHKLLNAPRDSLATVRNKLQRRPSSAKMRKNFEHMEAGEHLSEAQRLELEIDRRSIRNALQAAKADNLSKATRILDNIYKDSFLNADEKSNKLSDLHPKGPLPQNIDGDFPRIGVVDQSKLRQATARLSKGSSPGPTGFSENMMRLLVEDEESCLALCHMFRDVINGDLAENVRQRLTRCRIIALAKPQNGIRPVAMGDTILKICGTILLMRHSNTVEKFFQPVQRGILQRNACESIVHELLDEHDAGYTILTVDFKNDDDDDELGNISPRRCYLPRTSLPLSLARSCATQHASQIRRFDLIEREQPAYLFLSPFIYYKKIFFMKKHFF